jgi:hypothetical protein
VAGRDVAGEISGYETYPPFRPNGTVLLVRVEMDINQ